MDIIARFGLRGSFRIFSIFFPEQPVEDFHLDFSTGAEARRSLGIVIIGGVGFSTLLSLLVVPVLYLLLARFTKPSSHIARRLSVLEAEHRDAAAPAE